MTTSNEQPDKLSQWLRAEMERHGYDLQGPRAGGMTEFARDVGITLGSVSRMLKGEKRTPELDTLRKMGKLLGYSLGEMLVFAGMASEDELPVCAEDQREAERPAPKPRYEDPTEQHLWETPGLDERQRRFLIYQLQAMRRLESGEAGIPEATPGEVRELKRRG